MIQFNDKSTTEILRSHNDMKANIIKATKKERYS